MRTDQLHRPHQTTVLPPTSLSPVRLPCPQSHPHPIHTQVDLKHLYLQVSSHLEIHGSSRRPYGTDPTDLEPPKPSFPTSVAAVAVQVSGHTFPSANTNANCGASHCRHVVHATMKVCSHLDTPTLSGQVVAARAASLEKLTDVFRDPLRRPFADL